MPYLIERRKFVIPGDLLAEGNYNSGRNTFKEGDRIYSSMMGLSNNVGKNVYVIGLKGVYVPRVGDLVIGKVVDMRLGNWSLDINSPYTGILFTSQAVDRPFNARKEDMSSILDIGDLVLAKIISFERTRDPALTIRESGLGRIVHGDIVKMTPTKIPRLIGRRGSMINMIKRETGCNITIGQNGSILVSGKSPELEALTMRVIRKIDAEAHTSGLTDRVTKFVEKEKRDMNV